jgi:UDP-glucose 4-epimerase
LSASASSVGRVLVTGATGFLGPYVLRALTRAGWRVRIATTAASLNSRHETVAVGAIGGATEWSTALAGVDAVVHLAGRAHQSRGLQPSEREAYFEVNTAGTLRLAQAAADRVGAFVFVSTILVNGSSTDGRPPFTEADAAAPSGFYAESKTQAERGLFGIASERMAATIIRPPLIYGRHAKGNFALLARAIRAGVPLPLGAIENRRAFVAAETVAAFCAQAVADPQSHRGVFIVADDEQVSTTEFVRRMATAMDKKARLLPVPPTMMRLALRALGRGTVIDSLLGSLEVETTKAKSRGWRPVMTLDAGLRAALSEQGDAG